MPKIWISFLILFILPNIKVKENQPRIDIRLTVSQAKIASCIEGSLNPRVSLLLYLYCGIQEAVLANCKSMISANAPTFWAHLIEVYRGVHSAS